MKNMMTRWMGTSAMLMSCVLVTLGSIGCGGLPITVIIDDTETCIEQDVFVTECFFEDIIETECFFEDVFEEQCIIIGSLEICEEVFVREIEVCEQFIVGEIEVCEDVFVETILVCG